ncbi:MAG: MBL fold metallo-hydrolase [Aquificaceae bacterium]|nr:MBL fold metallo-hydrolase [Aquificaceae bacterium]
MWQKKSNGWFFYVLGSAGGRAKDRYSMCLYLPESLLLDAGNIFALSRDKLLQVEHVVLTHSHLDHLVDIPFLIDYTYGLREKPLKIYGLPETLDSLRKNIMNWDVWPEFSSLKLPTTDEYAVEYVQIKPLQEYHIDGYRLIPVESRHTVPTVSLIVKREGRGIVYTSDTYRNPELWKMIQEDPEIKLVLVDVSFPSYMSMVAQASLHHTPQSLREDIKIISRKDLRVYVVHIKPSHEKEVLEELRKLDYKVYPIVGKRKLTV